MRNWLWILFLLYVPLAVGGNPGNEVTIVLDFDQPYSDRSLAEMEREAGAVLKKSVSPSIGKQSNRSRLTLNSSLCSFSR